LEEAFMRIVMLAALTVLAAATVRPQNSSVPNVSKAQKSLKQALIDHTPTVMSVKFDGCRVAIKNIYSYDSYSEGRGASFGPDAEANGASQNLLSGNGGGSFTRAGSADLYVLDLSRIDLSQTQVGLISSGKSRSMLSIPTPAGSITAEKPYRPRHFDPVHYNITVSTKKAGQVLQAFRDYAAVCDQ
jgi:hypothetical protein